MLTPTYAHLLTHFYPVGNTPAVCLTQALPPEETAAILLLGCGDVRHVLFTAHSDSSSSIARNILLLSLIIDDTDGERNQENWDIYYSLYLTKASRDRLQAQAKKLHTLTASLDSWRESKYGRHIKFCDQGSLDRAAEIWKYYTREDLEKDVQEKIITAINRRNKMLGGDGITVGLSLARSAQPAGLMEVMELSQFSGNFWTHGTKDTDPKSLSQAAYGNPMLTSPESAQKLHYGTHPLHGFHLTTAYAPLTSGSPLFQQPAQSENTKSTIPDVAKAARAEFCAWSDSFRRQFLSSMITIRVFVGDAIAFSHVLTARRTTGDNGETNWYRSRDTMDLIELNKDEYRTEAASPAPLSFNVIDTSNLVDHVGALNLLVAVSPLLDEQTVSSAIYTEVLVKQGSSHENLIDSLLCGHLPTISVLLGLFPVDYWTNTSSTTAAYEAVMDAVLQEKGDGSGQSFIRITWKQQLATQINGLQSSQSNKHILRFDECGLAGVLYRLYLSLFSSHEDMSKLTSKLRIKTTADAKILKFPPVMYHRPGFVMFLHRVKAVVTVDWHKVMDVLLQHIKTDTTLLLGQNHWQELYLWMHLLGLHSVGIPKTPCNTTPAEPPSIQTGDLRDWSDMPSSVCVTIVVPRVKLGALTDGDPTRVGTLSLHCSVKEALSSARPWQNNFASIQIVFGELSNSGHRHTNGYRLRVVEDPMGWQGGAPLIVSFRAPSWMLLQAPVTTMVAFGVQVNPVTIHMFPRLGLRLEIFETALTDLDHVYISRDLPNQTGFMVLPGSHEKSSACVDENKASQSNFDIAIIADVDTTMGVMSSLTARLDAFSSNLRSALQSGATVKVASVPSLPRNMNFTITIGKLSPVHVQFPVPVMESKLKTRIARKSCFIELVMPVAKDIAKMHTDSFTYPNATAPIPIVWNLPYLNLTALPIIQIPTSHAAEKLNWITPHAGMMFSARERRLREDKSLPRSGEEDCRANFKESLFSLFAIFTGVQGDRRHHIFGLHDAKNGGIHILLFLSNLRLDLANRTVVIEGAVLPLYHQLMPKIRPLLSALAETGFVTMKVDSDEMKLWKHVLPAYVERCRTWAHKDSCEYVSRGFVAPLSVENGEEALCRCGNGVFPEKFTVDVPHWQTAARYSTPVAISPAFSSSLTETVCHDDMKKRIDCWPDRISKCWPCGAKEAKKGGRLLRCSRCQKTQYCSLECQKTDWPSHKRACGSA
ncbi:hypothetical protein B0T17DRAFT_495888 [Bombardia bombarda]|uniref:MYND-type domain-containing protein n=1 Tax=Bombardia bombarda TaxID=252184 RepID=A0AA39WLT7_9PEZI|nr:hypothetical protein B0T17DRAFT_495888 [Bombardia bombarda]